MRAECAQDPKHKLGVCVLSVPSPTKQADNDSTSPGENVHCPCVVLWNPSCYFPGVGGGKPHKKSPFSKKLLETFMEIELLSGICIFPTMCQVVLDTSLKPHTGIRKSVF